MVFSEMGQHLSKGRGAVGVWRKILLGHEISQVLDVTFTMNLSGLFAGLFSRMTHLGLCCAVHSCTVVSDFLQPHGL